MANDANARSYDKPFGAGFMPLIRDHQTQGSRCAHGLRGRVRCLPTRADRQETRPSDRVDGTAATPKLNDFPFDAVTQQPSQLLGQARIARISCDNGDRDQMADGGRS